MRSQLEASVVAAMLGPALAILSGGVATVLITGWIAWRFPVLRAYSSRTQAELVPA